MIGLFVTCMFANGYFIFKFGFKAIKLVAVKLYRKFNKKFCIKWKIKPAYLMQSNPPPLIVRPEFTEMAPKNVFDIENKDSLSVIKEVTESFSQESNKTETK